VPRGRRGEAGGDADGPEHDGAPGPGRVVRPRAVVLPDDALLPAANAEARPARLTHEVTRAAAYHLTDPAGAAPAGTLAAGTRVAVRGRRRGASCRVVREDGLAVYVPCDALRALRSR
jgi:hypothetical protein